jgi:hypothetical protein
MASLPLLLIFFEKNISSRIQAPEKMNPFEPALLPSIRIKKTLLTLDSVPN